MKHFLFRAGALAFAVCALTLAVLHGCSKPQPVAPRASGAAAKATTGAAAAGGAPASAQTGAQESIDEDPAYLGATKAAVIIRPKAAKPKPAANQANQK